eukprot:CAMPEP_0198362250 /NCGR_PEP_ID=MMETSP1450-20131203/145344_1 /TAXON_ID=753684 ORGANISM="Madagascaria erythrocladiodes, Strain CCMP3234" /NCGR_SAMPLE_ID=MMETSP1450 /ASSEMBLY_ACC=CAM_ASM_001115 /LENGTH=81 /DNA_ID=CAMNT_0044069447 /DNA_START=22 /DNA_END=265 /DNA_ORIENTATION=-
MSRDRSGRLTWAESQGVGRLLRRGIGSLEIGGLAGPRSLQDCAAAPQAERAHRASAEMLKRDVAQRDRVQNIAQRIQREHL